MEPENVDIDSLDEERRALWDRASGLWEMLLRRDGDSIRAAIHPAYSGWVTGQPQPHDRDVALAAAADESPRLRDYHLDPVGISIADGTAGIVHYRYAATLEAEGKAERISGRWTEIYLRRDGIWTMIGVSGGPDGQR